MIVLVMGVSGSGKSTVGALLAHRLGIRFVDGDDFHPPENIARMSAGYPLDDTHRRVWLVRIAHALESAFLAQESLVLACSALKQSYRDQLLAAAPSCRIVWLHGPRDLLHQRLQSRRHHFMPPGLLASQLATLEPPAGVLPVAVSDPPEMIVARLLQHLCSPEQPNEH